MSNDRDNMMDTDMEDSAPRRGGDDRRSSRPRRGDSDGGGGGGFRRRDRDRDQDADADADGGRGRRGRRRGTHCPEGKCFDYKDVDTLKRHLNETGKIKPRRQTKNCSRCQRELAREIKRARHLALLPFVSAGE